MAALRTLRKVQAETRPATAEEQSVLARWAGWGGAPKVFVTGDPKYAAVREELVGKDGKGGLLSPQEYEAAQINTANAHYTDVAIVEAMWTGLRALGFNGGNVLEPGSGAGNFIGRAPGDAKMTGVELDPVTAGIAQLLYPDADILNENFARTRVRPGMFDAVIGNVPFGQHREFDPDHNKGRAHLIHDHFILKGVAGLKPGGVMAVITSAGTLNKSDGEARRTLYEQADLVGAVRLPNGTHAAAADTDVVTDVLFLRKRKPGETPGDDSWLTSSPAHDSDGAPVLGIARGGGTPAQQHANDYFTANPQNILGEYRSGGYSGLAVKGDPDGAPAALRMALQRIVQDAEERGLTASQEAAPAAPVRKRPAPRARTTAVASDADLFTPPSDRTRARKKIVGQVTHTGARRVDGKRAGSPGSVEHTFTVVDLDGQEAPYVPAGSSSAGDGRKPNQADELAALLRLRDVRNDLIEAEKTTVVDDDEIRGLRAEMGRLYDAYVTKYGPLSRVKVNTREVKAPDDPENPPDDVYQGEDGKWFEDTRTTPGMGGIRKDPTWWSLLGLETSYDEDSNTAKKSAAFTKRQIGYRAIPDLAEGPDDALEISLEHDGRIDLPRIARLLDVDVEQVREVLGDRIFTDHETGELVPARQYLGGEVRQKLRAARKAAEGNPDLERNVRALEAVIPPDKDPTKITARLGMTWIPPQVFQSFLREITGNNKTTVVRDDKGAWSVYVGVDATSPKRKPPIEGGGRMERPVGHRGPLVAKWGTSLRTTYDLVETALKGDRARVTDVHDDLNDAETKAAQDKLEAIQVEFGKWLWRDETRAAAMHEVFNDRFRGFTDVNYVDSRQRTYTTAADLD